MSGHYLSSDAVATAWQRFALWGLARFGWPVNFAPVPGPRGIVIVYPHTSNRDFFIGLFAK